jgi:hypothetical protein
MSADRTRTHQRHAPAGFCAVLGPAIVLAACGGQRASDVRTNAAASALAWTTAAPVAGSNSGGAAAALAAAPHGALTVAWVNAPGAGREGRLQIETSRTASRATELKDAAGGGALTVYGETPPRLVYGPNGVLYAAYLVTRSERGHKWPVNTLRIAASRDGGNHWSDPVTVQADTARGGSTDDHALAVAPDGTLLLSWLALTRDTSHTYIARSKDGGRTWTSPTVIDSGPSCPCCHTGLTVGADGTVYAAWRKIYGNSAATEVRDIVVARSEDHGAHWSVPVRVHADDWHVNYCPDAGPSIRVGTNGVLHVAWWTGRPGGAGVRYVRSQNGGRTFEPAVELGVAAASRAAHTQVAVRDSDDVVVAYDDGTREVTPIVVRRSRDGGRTFSAGDTISAPGQIAGYPSVAIVGDSLFVAWQERSASGVVRDSTRQRATFDSLRRLNPADTSAGFINQVGSWNILLRGAAMRP